ncbi:hypothetical protein FF1_042031 [Malus domestica]
MAAMNSSSFGVVAIIATFYAIVLPVARATSLAPAPTPAPTSVSALTSDGTTIDQGIAYALMLLALVLTYLIH